MALAVCWIHSWVPAALLAAAGAIAPGGRLVHVIGSQSSDASAAAIAQFERRDDLHYQQVELGAASEDGRRRWLTNDEIAAGVYAAVVANEWRYLVAVSRREDCGPNEERRCMIGA